jgi:glycosidase
MSELADVLAADALYPHPERLVPFAGNHDTSRLAEVVRDPALRELAFAYLLTTRGTPQIYAGDEISMRGGDDPGNRADFPGGFAPVNPGPNAFLTAGRTPEEQRSYQNTTDQQVERPRERPASPILRYSYFAQSKRVGR